MNQEKRWEMLIALDEELLKGGVVLSEWCSFIVREADMAFVNGAHLASILTAVSESKHTYGLSIPKQEKSAWLISSMKLRFIARSGTTSTSCGNIRTVGCMLTIHGTTLAFLKHQRTQSKN